MLWEHEGEGAWHFVTLPEDLADDVRDAAAPSPGFGSVRVVVRIGEVEWRTSLFPDSKSRSYVLPVKKQVRAANGVAAGDVVRVGLTLG